MQGLRRILKSGWLNFKRGGTVSAATVLVMTLTLVVIQGLLLFTAATNALVTKITDKVDISVYFKTDVPEDQILKIKKEVAALNEVADVEYVSREKALLDFQAQHKGNDLLQQALDELGGNPLEASINIRARDPRNYASIAQFLQAERFRDEVSKINYSENQIVIDRLASIISFVKKIGLGITLTSAVISVLVAFNTVRLAIANSKEEIGIMKLVGGTNWFIRAPFIIEGMIHGAVASLGTMLVYFPFTAWFGPRFEDFLAGINLFSYFKANFFETFLVLLGVGMTLGILSSFIAIRRYLKV